MVLSRVLNGRGRRKVTRSGPDLYRQALREYPGPELHKNIFRHQQFNLDTGQFLPLVLDSA
jgi:hypothetical protein